MIHSILTFIFVVIFPLIVHSATVELSWRDNSNNESGFYIERRVGRGSRPFQRIMTVPSNTRDTTLPIDIIGERLCYRIVAFNAAGNAAPSNSKCVTVYFN